jgi:RNA polymerase sigma factor for flagellar operon FliA
MSNATESTPQAPPRPTGRQLKAYQNTQKQVDEEQQIEANLPLVRSLVERIAFNLPSHVDRDDLFHAGVIGLMEAVRRYDASRHNAFSTYAVLRIRGAIIDELRARDWIPRASREKTKRHQEAIRELTINHGRLPSDDELADALGIQIAELPAFERQASLHNVLSLDKGSEDDDGNMTTQHLEPADPNAANDPTQALGEQEQRELLVAALGNLKEQERLVLKLYYFEGLLMREIAEVLNVTESRVCQIHRRAMPMLRGKLIGRIGAIGT